VRIEQAIFDLWRARDDAHMAAWRGVGMEGLPMSVLTALWSEKQTRTVSQLLEATSFGHNASNLEESLAYLTSKGYVARDDDEITLTREGMLAREGIERETDRIYFSSWPHTLEEARWVGEKLRELVDELPTLVT